MTAMHLVAAIGREENSGHVAKLAGEVLKEREAGLVGPVKIFYDEQHRRLARECRDEPVERDREPVLVYRGRIACALRAAELGEELGEVRCRLRQHAP